MFLTCHHVYGFDIASRNKVLKDVFNLPSCLWIEIIEQVVNKNFCANSNKLLPKPKFFRKAYIKRPKNDFGKCFKGWKGSFGSVRSNRWELRQGTKT